MIRALAALGAAGIASAASADVLWHQEPLPETSAVQNPIFLEFGGFGDYLATDVTFDTDVTVNSVTMYFSGGENWAAIGAGTAILNQKEPPPCPVSKMTPRSRAART